MLYVATVHYRTPRWIEIQTSHLRRHVRAPMQIWSSLEHIDPAYGKYFARILDQRGSHAGKLNHMAMEIAQEAEAGDLVMFIDGDAFQIADVMSLIEDGLARAGLVAVRRAENVNEPQPHPCFCVTTGRTWLELPGDWTAGPTWTGARGKRTTDVGANLLRRLELTSTPRVQVLRSNRRPRSALLWHLRGRDLSPRGGVSRGGAEPGRSRPRTRAASVARCAHRRRRDARGQRLALAHVGTPAEAASRRTVAADLRKDPCGRLRSAVGMHESFSRMHMSARVNARPL